LAANLCGNKRKLIVSSISNSSSKPHRIRNNRSNILSNEAHPNAFVQKNFLQPQNEFIKDFYAKSKLF